eukprot:g3403.t1
MPDFKDIDKMETTEPQVITRMSYAYIEVNSEEATTDEEIAEKEKKIEAAGKRLDTKFNKRTQRKLTQEEIEEMQTVFERWCKRHNLPSTYTLEDCGILHSDKNCPMQHFHCDAAAVNTYTREGRTLEQMELAMICCPWSDGGLMVRQRKRKEKGKPLAKKVKIKKGQCIVFRGDFIHAGAAYKIENERLHLHLKPNMAGFDEMFQMRTKGNVESPHSANVKFNIAGFKTSRAHKLFYGCKIQNSQLFFLEQKNGLSKWINHKSISKPSCNKGTYFLIAEYMLGSKSPTSPNQVNTNPVE